MNVFEYLNARYELEEILRKYKVPFKDATIGNCKWFVKNGHKSNRFRPNYNRALELAETIVEKKNEKA